MYVKYDWLKMIKLPNTFPVVKLTVGVGYGYRD